MPSRRRSRERALQVLFQWDLRKLPVDEVIETYYTTLLLEDEDGPGFEPPDPFMETLARGTVRRAEEIDQAISRHSEHWRLERMPAVDRNILRVAVYEMIDQPTPPPVVIDEALELARRFSSEESVPFVNGVLDAVMREMRQAAPPGGNPAGH